MLDTDIEATADADGVTFAVTVANDGDEDATLSFRSAQRVEVTVAPADGGDPVWRASEGRMFAQMLGSETVPAGDDVTFEARWESPSPGEYEVAGEVVAADRELTATTTLTV